MKINAIKKDFPAPETDILEAARYAGAGRIPDEKTVKMLEALYSECGGVLNYSVCYSELPITRTDDTTQIGILKTSSKNLSTLLSGCERATVFAATVGHGMDRLIRRASVISSAKAVLLDGIGTERVEALADAFCEEYRREACERGFTVTDRFSTGYGDLPLELQKEIFEMLDCPSLIGAALNDSLLISPAKTVSAIFGLKRKS